MTATTTTTTQHTAGERLHILTHAEQDRRRNSLLASLCPAPDSGKLHELVSRDDLWRRVEVVEQQIADSAGKSEKANLRNIGLDHLLAETARALARDTASHFYAEMDEEGIDWLNENIIGKLAGEIVPMLRLLAVRCERLGKSIYDNGRNAEEVAGFVFEGISKAVGEVFNSSPLMIWVEGEYEASSAETDN